MRGEVIAHLPTQGDKGRRMQRSAADRCAGVDAGGWRAMVVMVGQRPREQRTIDGGP